MDKYGIVISNTAWGYDYWGNFFGKTQLDMLKAENANIIRIMLDKYAWDINSTANILKIPYKDYIKQLVEWCKPELEVILDLTRDSRFGDFSSTEKEQVILNPAEWINWGKEVVSYCNPDRIGLMNEPNGNIPVETYLSSFVNPSVAVYRAIKPELKIHIMPIPFYRFETLHNHSYPDDSNIFYEWHLYYPAVYPHTGSHIYLNNAVNAYFDGRLEEGKAELYKYLDNFKFPNVNKSKVFWGEAGVYGTLTAEPTQPNWRQWMKDVYNYVQSRGLNGVTTYAAGLKHYCIFDPETDYNTFTVYGQDWADNSPPTPPTQAPVPFDLVLISMAILALA